MDPIQESQKYLSVPQVKPKHPGDIDSEADILSQVPSFDSSEQSTILSTIQPKKEVPKKLSRKHTFYDIYQQEKQNRGLRVRKPSGFKAQHRGVDAKEKEVQIGLEIIVSDSPTQKPKIKSHPQNPTEPDNQLTPRNPNLKKSPITHKATLSPRSSRSLGLKFGAKSKSRKLSKRNGSRRPSDAGARNDAHKLPDINSSEIQQFLTQREQKRREKQEFQDEINFVSPGKEYFDRFPIKLGHELWLALGKEGNGMIWNDAPVPITLCRLGEPGSSGWEDSFGCVEAENGVVDWSSGVEEAWVGMMEKFVEGQKEKWLELQEGKLRYNTEYLGQIVPQVIIRETEQGHAQSSQDSTTPSTSDHSTTSVHHQFISTKTLSKGLKPGQVASGYIYPAGQHAQLYRHVYYNDTFVSGICSYCYKFTNHLPIVDMTLFTTPRKLSVAEVRVHQMQMVDRCVIDTTRPDSFDVEKLDYDHEGFEQKELLDQFAGNIVEFVKKRYSIDLRKIVIDVVYGINGVYLSGIKSYEVNDFCLEELKLEKQISSDQLITSQKLPVQETQKVTPKLGIIIKGTPQLQDITLTSGVLHINLTKHKPNPTSLLSKSTTTTPSPLQKSLPSLNKSESPILPSPQPKTKLPIPSSKHFQPYGVTPRGRSDSSESEYIPHKITNPKGQDPFESAPSRTIAKACGVGTEKVRVEVQYEGDGDTLEYGIEVNVEDMAVRIRVVQDSQEIGVITVYRFQDKECSGPDFIDWEGYETQCLSILTSGSAQKSMVWNLDGEVKDDVVKELGGVEKKVVQMGQEGKKDKSWVSMPTKGSNNRSIKLDNPGFMYQQPTQNGSSKHSPKNSSSPKPAAKSPASPKHKDKTQIPTISESKTPLLNPKISSHKSKSSPLQLKSGQNFRIRTFTSPIPLRSKIQSPKPTKPAPPQVKPPIQSSKHPTRSGSRHHVKRDFIKNLPWETDLEQAIRVQSARGIRSPGSRPINSARSTRSGVRKGGIRVEVWEQKNRIESEITGYSAKLKELRQKTGSRRSCRPRKRQDLASGKDGKGRIGKMQGNFGQKKMEQGVRKVRVMSQSPGKGEKKMASVGQTGKLVTSARLRSGKGSRINKFSFRKPHKSPQNPKKNEKNGKLRKPSPNHKKVKNHKKSPNKTQKVQNLKNNQKSGRRGLFMIKKDKSKFHLKTSQNPGPPTENPYELSANLSPYEEDQETLPPLGEPEEQGSFTRAMKAVKPSPGGRKQYYSARVKREGGRKVGAMVGKQLDMGEVDGSDEGEGGYQPSRTTVEIDSLELSFKEPDKIVPKPVPTVKILKKSTTARSSKILGFNTQNLKTQKQTTSKKLKLKKLLTSPGRPQLPVKAKTGAETLLATDRTLTMRIPSPDIFKPVKQTKK